MAGFHESPFKKEVSNVPGNDKIIWRRLNSDEPFLIPREPDLKNTQKIRIDFDHGRSSVLSNDRSVRALPEKRQLYNHLDRRSWLSAPVPDFGPKKFQKSGLFGPRNDTSDAGNDNSEPGYRLPKSCSSIAAPEKLASEENQIFEEKGFKTCSVDKVGGGEIIPQNESLDAIKNQMKSTMTEERSLKSERAGDCAGGDIPEPESRLPKVCASLASPEALPGAENLKCEENVFKTCSEDKVDGDETALRNEYLEISKKQRESIKSKGTGDCAANDISEPESSLPKVCSSMAPPEPSPREENQKFEENVFKTCSEGGTVPQNVINEQMETTMSEKKGRKSKRTDDCAANKPITRASKVSAGKEQEECPDPKPKRAKSQSPPLLSRRPRRQIYTTRMTKRGTRK